jgi:hypothetical protein
MSKLQALAQAPAAAVWTFREGEIWEISKILTIRIFFYIFSLASESLCV